MVDTISVVVITAVFAVHFRIVPYLQSYMLCNNSISNRYDVDSIEETTIDLVQSLRSAGLYKFQRLRRDLRCVIDILDGW